MFSSGRFKSHHRIWEKMNPRPREEESHREAEESQTFAQESHRKHHCFSIRPNSGPDVSPDVLTDASFDASLDASSHVSPDNQRLVAPCTARLVDPTCRPTRRPTHRPTDDSPEASPDAFHNASPEAAPDQTGIASRLFDQEDSSHTNIK